MSPAIRTGSLRTRAVMTAAALVTVATLVGWAGASGGTDAGGSGSRTGSGVHLVWTTPSAKGKLSSISWDLPAGEPTTLDYVKSGDYGPDIMVSNMCDYLLRLTPRWQYEPGLAQSWHYANPTTLVLNIRRGVRFWNGQELTSADVVYSMLRNMNPKDGPVNGAYYEFVKSITATGKFQVTVKFSEPDELFVKEMATVAGAVAEKSYMEAKKSSYGTAAGGVMCSGPYELKKWNPGNDIVLQANPHYWDPAYTPKIKTITVRFIVNTSTLTSALLSGEIAGSYEVPATSFPELEKASDGKMYFGPSLAVLEMAPASTTGPISKVKVREALSLAIDRSAIARVVFSGAATPNKALTPKTAWDPTAESIYRSAYSKLPSITPNLAKARRLVKSVPDHSGKITLAFLAGDQTELEIATAVQQAGQEIGLNVKLDQMQPLAFSNLFYLPQYRKGVDLVETFGYLDVPDPLDYLGLFIGKGAIFNWTNYENGTVNADVKKAYETYNAAARARLITAAQAIYTKDYLVIPMLNPDEGLFLNKKVTGAPVSFAYIYEPCLAKLGAAK